MEESIETQHAWLTAHPEEEAKYAGEFIAVADGRIVAHGKNAGEVLGAARKLGYEPLLAQAYGDEVLVF